MTTNDLVPATGRALVVGPPSPMEWHAIQEQAATIHASGLAPKRVDTVEKVLAIALKGRELQVPPMEALAQINIIEGTPALSAQLMRSLVRRAGHKIRVLEHSDEKAVVQGVRADDPDYPLTVTWTPQTAADAGLCAIRDGKVEARAKSGSKLPWETYTAALLLARASSQLCRAIFDDVLMGAPYTPEELGVIDINPETGEPIEVDPKAAYRDPKWTAALNRIEQLLADAEDAGVDVDPGKARDYADLSLGHAEATVRNLERRLSPDAPDVAEPVAADDGIEDAVLVDDEPEPEITYTEPEADGTEVPAEAPEPVTEADAPAHPSAHEEALTGREIPNAHDIDVELITADQQTQLREAAKEAGWSTAKLKERAQALAIGEGGEPPQSLAGVTVTVAAELFADLQEAKEQT